MGLWEVPASELKAPTPMRVRDLIVECFLRAQHEALERSARSRGKQATEAELRKTIVHSVRSAMTEIGGQWDAATVPALRDTVARLGERAAAWGTPQDIIDHHVAQILRLLDACKSAD